jgi:hypothetical protein
MRHERTSPLRPTTVREMSRIFRTSVASVYPHYVTKVEKKSRTKAELHQVIEWLTGFDDAALDRHLASGTTFEGLLHRCAA